MLISFPFVLIITVRFKIKLMAQPQVINKSTFVFCNVDDPDEEIKF